MQNLGVGCPETLCTTAETWGRLGFSSLVFPCHSGCQLAEKSGQCVPFLCLWDESSGLCFPHSCLNAH